MHTDGFGTIWVEDRRDISLPKGVNGTLQTLHKFPGEWGRGEVGMMKDEERSMFYCYK